MLLIRMSHVVPGTALQHFTIFDLALSFMYLHMLFGFVDGWFIVSLRFLCDVRFATTQQQWQLAEPLAGCE